MPKAKKVTKKRPSKKASEVTRIAEERATTVLTPDGHKLLVEELEELTAQRPEISDEIQRAAADKDVRENAPLEAARERQGMVEARIRQLEAILSEATVMDETDKSSNDATTIRMGSKIQIKELSSEREFSYQVVSAPEANPREGKLSVESPVGKSIFGKGEGEEVEVETPRGLMKYLIVKIG
ncbi:MAG: transcription elongation factor GreA [SAR202 cluster bacterium]|nr:transcription elongation factor GreA [SAR202 cluster bacterium]|tara:strand:- start:1334 stop:1882 length:549 start_codon:yes stop_codon:yes gene_type:complete